MKLLLALYLLVALKEAIDFKTTSWDGKDSVVDWCAMFVCALLWPVCYPIWISVRIFKMVRPSPSHMQYQMFAKEK
jgi:hypothetical protein